MPRIVSLSGNRSYYTNSFFFFYKHSIYSSHSLLVRIFDNFYYFFRYLFVKFFLSPVDDLGLENAVLSSLFVKYALLDTSWYKPTRLIGYIQLDSGKICFTKVFKTEKMAKIEFENYFLIKHSKLAREFFIPVHWRQDSIVYSEAISVSGIPDFNYLLKVCRDWDEDLESEPLIDTRKQAIVTALLKYNDGLQDVLLRFNSRVIETVLSHGDFKLENIIKTSSETTNNRNCYAIVDYECVGMYPKYYDFFSLVMGEYDYDYKRVTNLIESLFGSWDNMKEHVENFLMFKLSNMILECERSPNNKFLQKQVCSLECFLDELNL